MLSEDSCGNTRAGKEKKYKALVALGGKGGPGERSTSCNGGSYSEREGLDE